MTPLRQRLLAAAAMATVLGVAPALAQGGGAGVLLEHAAFWRAQGQPARAAATLERVLAVHPAHADALAAAAMAQIELGQPAVAQGYFARLRQVAPEDTRVARIAEALGLPVPRVTPVRATPPAIDASLQTAGNREAAELNRVRPPLVVEEAPRLFQGARDPRVAGRIAEAVLRRDPRNAEARVGAIDAAVALGDLASAEVLLAEGQQVNGNESRLSYAEARLALAQGDLGRAQTALRLAAEQRRAQIGQDAPLAVAAANGRRTLLSGDGQGSSFVPLDANPATPSAGGVTPSQLRASDDPLLSEIGRQLAEVNERTDGRVVPNFTFRARSGGRGLERMREYGGGAEVAAPLPELGGELSARVQAAHIDTGRLDATVPNLRRFGSNALVLPGPGATVSDARAAALRPRDDSATGTSLALGYTRGPVTVDVGSTPLGFREQTVLGGIEWVPRLSETFQLRLRGERRSVTDSLLSWSGMRDGASGTPFGGVTRVTGRGQLEYYEGRVSAYGGGGYSAITGRNVADNRRWEAAGGFSYALLRSPTNELTAGLDLTAIGYEKNLRGFTLGQGGYFSPQNYYNASIPVDYRERIGNFAYRVGASVGVANFRESASRIFPNNPDLQATLEQQALSDPTIATRYAGQRSTTVTAGARLDLEYALTPTLRVGATARYDRAADFNETRALVYARYRFDP
ncbi:cellulose synthase subunit BcsC-related outer membrane protein [Muricoccus aerilatus]|uniref:cellulose synthase subunit BcsC-related outer membrane protein n=1 Tax=Muricoccus aerilatus TaxID=452982 RepID=UPI0005C20BA6|nr:cellulose synthase subunit BcsC-related outer membrane protein [Roseomonas aerilata]